MANPNRYSSSDVPGYENYPSPTATDFGRPSFSENSPTSVSANPNTNAQSALPPHLEGRWDGVARQIGSNLGRIVCATLDQTATASASVANGAHTARERVYETFDNKVKPVVSSARDIFETRVKPTMDTATTQAREKFEHAQQQMREQLAATQRRVRDTYDRTSVQVKQMVDQHPLETILAAGLAGVLVGVGLRYWRDNRAS